MSARPWLSRASVADHADRCRRYADGIAADRKKYSFPVIVGMNSGEPPSTRAARMKIYNDVVSQLDAGGAHYSQELSEIDLSDPDDVKVMANNHAGEVLVHLGSANYLDRYKIYVTHLQEWQQQFDKLESVDLRYDRQIIVNPDLQGPMKQAPLSAEAAKTAMAAGVKPAALISAYHFRSQPAPTLAVKRWGHRWRNRLQLNRRKLQKPRRPDITKPTSGRQSVEQDQSRIKSKAAAAQLQRQPSRAKSVAAVKPWQNRARQLPREKHNRNGEPARAPSDRN